MLKYISWEYALDRKQEDTHTHPMPKFLKHNIKQRRNWDIGRVSASQTYVKILVWDVYTGL